MKNLFIIILAVAVIVAGSFCIAQRNQLRAQSAQLAEAQARLANLEAQLKQQSDAIEEARVSESKTKILQKTLTEATVDAAQKSKQTEQLKQSLAAAKTNNSLKGLAAMFKNPEMRKMMEAQQKTMMGPLIAKQYKDLFQQLNLTPEQTDALKTLLQNKQMAGASASFSLLDDSLDDSQRAALTAQIKSQTDDIDNQIKQLLGDNYQAYQDYNKTIPARTTVNQFMDQVAGTANAVSADQQQQLVQAMTQSINNYQWTSALNQSKANGSDQRDPVAQLALLTDDNINQAAAETEQFDQQFLLAAQKILTPDQVTAFQQFQTSWRQMQTSAMKVAAQMFPHGNQGNP